MDTLTLPKPLPLPRAPPSKVQLSLTPDVVLAAPTVGVSLPFPWIFCREVPTRRVWVTLLNGIWPRYLLPQPLCTHHGDQSVGLSRRCAFLFKVTQQLPSPRTLDSAPDWDMKGGGQGEFLTLLTFMGRHQ